MVTPELMTYIKSQLALGQSKENIENILLANHWPEADVREAIRTATGAAAPEPKPAPAAPPSEPVIEIFPKEPVAPLQAAPQVAPQPVQKPVMGPVPFRKPIDAVATSPAPARPGPLGAAPVGAPGMQPAVSPKATASRFPKLSLKPGNDFLKVGIGIAVGIAIGIAGSAGWGAIRTLLLKSPSPTPVAVSPSPEPSVSPSPTPMTIIPYINTRYGFSFDYPEGWDVNESGSMGNQAMFSDTESGVARIEVAAATTTKTFTLNKWVDESIAKAKKATPDYTVARDEARTVGTASARLIEATFSEGDIGAHHIQLYTLSASSSLLLTATAAESAWNTYEELFVRVLDSVKFL